MPTQNAARAASTKREKIEFFAHMQQRITMYLDIQHKLQKCINCDAKTDEYDAERVIAAIPRDNNETLYLVLCEDCFPVPADFWRSSFLAAFEDYYPPVLKGKRYLRDAVKHIQLHNAEQAYYARNMKMHNEALDTASKPEYPCSIDIRLDGTDETYPHPFEDYWDIESHISYFSMSSRELAEIAYDMEDTDTDSSLTDSSADDDFDYSPLFASRVLASRAPTI